jgi:hypothetical protein
VCLLGAGAVFVVAFVVLVVVVGLGLDTSELDNLERSGILPRAEQGFIRLQIASSSAASSHVPKSSIRIQ